MIRPPVSGTMFIRMYSLSGVENSLNTGNAENRVNAMVISGTTDNSVVKVRLAAICVHLSSCRRTVT